MDGSSKFRWVALLREVPSSIARHYPAVKSHEIYPRKQQESPTAPSLIALVGIGTGHASQLLITAGQNIDRLCGVAPIPVSSGKTQRMRLHRGGDRQANRALYMIAICRLKYDPRTIAYVARRTAEGLSKKDAIRCLKRFISWEVYNALKHDLNTA